MFCNLISQIFDACDGKLMFAIFFFKILFLLSYLFYFLLLSKNIFATLPSGEFSNENPRYFAYATIWISYPRYARVASATLPSGEFSNENQTFAYAIVWFSINNFTYR